MFFWCWIHLFLFLNRDTSILFLYSSLFSEMNGKNVLKLITIRFVLRSLGESAKLIIWYWKIFYSSFTIFNEGKERKVRRYKWNVLRKKWENQEPEGGKEWKMNLMCVLTWCKCPNRLGLPPNKRPATTHILLAMNAKQIRWMLLIASKCPTLRFLLLIHTLCLQWLCFFISSLNTNKSNFLCMLDIVSAAHIRSRLSTAH